jgi:hypothetical protein
MVAERRSKSVTILFFYFTKFLSWNSTNCLLSFTRVQFRIGLNNDWKLGGYLVCCRNAQRLTVNRKAYLCLPVQHLIYVTWFHILSHHLAGFFCHCYYIVHGFKKLIFLIKYNFIGCFNIKIVLQEKKELIFLDLGAFKNLRNIQNEIVQKWKKLPKRSIECQMNIKISFL